MKLYIAICPKPFGSVANIIYTENLRAALTLSDPFTHSKNLVSFQKLKT